MKTAEEILAEKGSYMYSVSPDTTIDDALQMMVDKRIGAILVKEGEEFVGIWTERDLMRNTIEAGFDPKSAKIGDYMTKGLISAPYDCPMVRLADKFVGKKLRHLLIERDGKYIGLLSTKDVIKFSLEEKARELDELNEIMHLDFYEEWRWKKKKKRPSAG